MEIEARTNKRNRSLYDEWSLEITLSEQRLHKLHVRGVEIPDPRQVYIDNEVDLNRISPGAVLHPGTRVQGSRAYIGRGCQVGTEGPATIENSVLGENVVVASGFVKGSVLLAGARLGANAHVRPGTLLEEGASTAHAVGLKQTVLMAHVTLGSLINLCDALVSGGKSAKVHTEIGSGFVHFNYTPFGNSGDKATPSLFGDVSRGVFLREERIFIGGLSGMVGPHKVGFGAVTVAGQVIRNDVADDHLFGSVGFEKNRPFSRHRIGLSPELMDGNVKYVRQLFALRAWYRSVRLRRARELSEGVARELVLTEALRTIDESIRERTSRLNDLRGAFGLPSVSFSEGSLQDTPSFIEDGLGLDHFEWLKTLSDDQVLQGKAWLEGIASSVDFVEAL